MPPKIRPTIGTESKGRKKKNKQPTQVHPSGMVMHKVLGANGKVRWEWMPKSGSATE